MALHPTRRSILAGATLVGLLPVAPGLAQEATGRAPVVGAGSTFAYPVMSHWSRAYMRARFESEYDVGGSGLDEAPAGEALSYEPVGEPIERFLEAANGEAQRVVVRRVGEQWAI